MSVEASFDAHPRKESQVIYFVYQKALIRTFYPSFLTTKYPILSLKYI